MFTFFPQLLLLSLRLQRGRIVCFDIDSFFTWASRVVCIPPVLIAILMERLRR